MPGAKESEKVRENRLRRMAERQGLKLEKSRRRDPRALDYGTYWLVDPDRGTVVAGDTHNGYGLSLDDIERALTEDGNASIHRAAGRIPGVRSASRGSTTLQASRVKDLPPVQRRLAERSLRGTKRGA